MKNIFKVLGIIILIVVIGFSFITCEEDDGGNIINNSGEAWVGSSYGNNRFGYIKRLGEKRDRRCDRFSNGRCI